MFRRRCGITAIISIPAAVFGGPTLVPSAAINTISGRHPLRNSLTFRSSGRGRHPLPPLLPPTERHHAPTLRGVAGVLRPAASPPRDRHPIRIHLRHLASGDPRVPQLVSCGDAPPLFAAPQYGRPARPPTPCPETSQVADRRCLRLEPGRRLRSRVAG